MKAIGWFLVAVALSGCAAGDNQETSTSRTAAQSTDSSSAPEPASATTEAVQGISAPSAVDTSSSATASTPTPIVADSTPPPTPQPAAETTSTSAAEPITSAAEAMTSPASSVRDLTDRLDRQFTNVTSQEGEVSPELIAPLGENLQLMRKALESDPAIGAAKKQDLSKAFMEVEMSFEAALLDEENPERVKRLLGATQEKYKEFSGKLNQ